MKNIFKYFKRDFKTKRVHTFAIMSASKDFVWGFSKLVLAFVGASFFIGLNALFSFGLGTTRVLCLKNRHADLEKQKSFYRITGILLCLCSMLYIAYSIRLFFVEESIRYSMVMGISIAAFTFFEFGFNIHDFIKYKHSFTPATKAIKMVTFCSTLTCFVLTQIALTSFNSAHAGMWNGVMGVVIGTVCFVIGVFMATRRSQSFKMTTPTEMSEEKDDNHQEETEK